MSTLIIAIILFAITYVLLFTFPKFRHWIALGSAVVFSLWLSLICKDVDFTLKNVIEAIQNGTKPLIDAEAGKRALELVLAIYIPFFLIKYMGNLIIMSNEVNGAILAF